jgi:hypothetical protein
MRVLTVVIAALVLSAGLAPALACEGAKSAAMETPVTTADGSTVIVTQTPRPATEMN